MALSADFAAAIGGERMSGRWLWVFGLLAGVVAGGLTAAPLSMAALQAKLAAVPVQRCQFAQRRTLPALETPLLSSGQMIFDRQLGLWWRQQQPFVMTLRLNAQRFEQQLEGQAPEVLTPQQQPQLFEFSRLMLSLFVADRTVLEQAFNLSLHSQGPAWQLQLHPRQPPLDQVFRQLTLQGEQGLEQLQIADQQGGTTQIEFHDCHPSPAELSDAERRLFSR